MTNYEQNDLRADSVPDRGIRQVENIGIPTAKPKILQRPKLQLNLGAKISATEKV